MMSIRHWREALPRHAHQRSIEIIRYRRWYSWVGTANERLQR
jgi:hypothetical protein